jgi:acyl carrier protein phosphodiesterase
MNILFHMYLSGFDPELLVGNFMGDFVKGPIGNNFALRIGQGLNLHRKIDSFAQSNVNFQASRLRLDVHFGLYRGVLIDLFYDHFLASEWISWADTPLPDYIASTRVIIDKYLPIMPDRLKEFVPIIFDELLPSYANISGIESALQRMSRRVRRPNPLAEGGAELTTHYEELKADFGRFVIEAKQYTSEIIATGGDI